MTERTVKRRVAFLSTCLPRECGLAVFTQDLINELEQMKDFHQPRVVAVNNNKRYTYGNQVMGQINQDNRLEYCKMALELNCSNIDLLIIQHEFGIYGGESGEYVLDLVEKLRIPFIVIFHTVLSKPSRKQREIVNRLADLSFKAITMAQNTVEDLHTIYGIAPEKVEMFHHGVPFVDVGSRDTLKQRYGYANRQIVSTFGFLSPGKGIEFAIEAMSGVVVRHPEALYIVWGKTHPVVKQENGEVYRQKLLHLVSALGLDNNIQFVDKLLTQEEVVQSLVLSDVYMTPYLGKDQAVSGTLAYGIGYGRVIVSTPYRYAVEMLADGRGLLADFRDSASLESCILEILDHPERKREMEERVLTLGRTMMWSEIAKRYAVLFLEIININSSSKESVI